MKITKEEEKKLMELMVIVEEKTKEITNIRAEIEKVKKEIEKLKEELDEND